MSEREREELQAGLSPATRTLVASDEILQVMFWLRGEGLAPIVEPADLVRWVEMSEERILPLLGRLESRGWIERVGGSARFRLTEEGAEEGGRRFAAEFSDITKPGHGECGDPACECQATGRPEDCRHHHHPHV